MDYKYHNKLSLEGHDLLKKTHQKKEWHGLQLKLDDIEYNTSKELDLTIC